MKQAVQRNKLLISRFTLSSHLFYKFKSGNSGVESMTITCRLWINGFNSELWSEFKKAKCRKKKVKKTVESESYLRTCATNDWCAGSFSIEWINDSIEAFLEMLRNFTQESSSRSSFVFRIGKLALLAAQLKIQTSGKLAQRVQFVGVGSASQSRCTEQARKRSVQFLVTHRSVSVAHFVSTVASVKERCVEKEVPFFSPSLTRCFFVSFFALLFSRLAYIASVRVRVRARQYTCTILCTARRRR